MSSNGPPGAQRESAMHSYRLLYIIYNKYNICYIFFAESENCYIFLVISGAEGVGGGTLASAPKVHFPIENPY